MDELKRSRDQHLMLWPLTCVAVIEMCGVLVRVHRVGQVSVLNLPQFLPSVRIQENLDLCKPERFSRSFYKLYFSQCKIKFKLRFQETSA